MVDKYVAEFRERFGHVNCRQLTGLDLKTREGLREYFARVHGLHLRCTAEVRS